MREVWQLSGVWCCQVCVLAFVLHLPPWAPHLLGPLCLPVIICVGMWSSHVCGIGLMVIISLSNQHRSLQQGENLREGQRRLFHLIGWIVLSVSDRMCNVSGAAAFSPPAASLTKHLSLFLCGTIRRLIWLSWCLSNPLCWCYVSLGSAGGKLAAPLEHGSPFLCTNLQSWTRNGAEGLVIAQFWILRPS